MGSRGLALFVAPVLLSGCLTVAPPSPSVTPPMTGTVPPATPAPSPTPAAASFDGPVTARYFDGLPSQLGNVVVHRDGGALDYAASQEDTKQFLVTGWVTFLDGTYYCPSGANRDWLYECPAARFSNTAGTFDPALTDQITFHNVLHGLASGPVVAVAHVHDPLAAAKCGAAAAACDRMMVVDRIVWRGDAAAAPGPITAEIASRALASSQASTDMTLFSRDSINQFCMDALPGALYYVVPSGADRIPGVVGVELEPDAAAMSRASPVTPGVASALRKSALSCLVDSKIEYRWFVVENAAFMIRTHHRPTSADRAFLERLEALLTGSG